MYVFRRCGLYVEELIEACILFFCFMGHLFCSLVDLVLGRLSISWFKIVKTIYYSGAKLAIPLMLINTFVGISIILKIHAILAQYNLQHEARLIAQNILTRDVVPFFIGVLLCIQSALNLINDRVDDLFNVPQQVVVDQILPIIVGINIAGVLLYTYTITAFFFSLYITFQYILIVSQHVSIMNITGDIRLFDIIYSILRTLLYCTIVSVTIGYYYYEVVISSRCSLRQGVSRIMTRGILWLTLCGVCFNYFNL